MNQEQFKQTSNYQLAVLNNNQTCINLGNYCVKPNTPNQIIQTYYKTYDSKPFSHTSRFYYQQFLPYVVLSTQTSFTNVGIRNINKDIKNIQHILFTNLHTISILRCQLRSLQCLAFLNVQTIEYLNLIYCCVTNLKSLAKTNWRQFEGFNLTQNLFDNHQFIHLYKARYAQKKKIFIAVHDRQKYIISTKIIKKPQPQEQTIVNLLFKLPIKQVDDNCNLLLYIKNDNIRQVMKRKLIAQKDNQQNKI